MNSRIKKLYIVIKRNKVVAYGTNLKDTYTMFTESEPSAEAYINYYRRFIKSDSFIWEGYHFHKLASKTD